MMKKLGTSWSLISMMSKCPNCNTNLLPALYGKPLGTINLEDYFVQGCIISKIRVNAGCRVCKYSEYVDGTSFNPIRDRQLGVMLGLALGDALGEPYEFKPPVTEETPITFYYNDNWHPGRWTDDTAMAISLLQSWLKFESLTFSDALDDLIGRWQDWAKTASDCGVQTRYVLQSITKPQAREATLASEALHIATGRSGGNGSLMRTAPLAFANLPDSQVAELVTRISKLTHYDEDAAHACIIWVFAIRTAIKTGLIDFEPGFDYIPVEVHEKWQNYLLEAQRAKPVEFENNGWVVSAFRAAASAVFIGEDDLYTGLEAAVRAGYDTDTVAAIAGSLLGAIHGAKEIPIEVRELLHGWPDYSTDDLINLTESVLNLGRKLGDKNI
jgi:ADP-ribosylglycohydrolase